MTQTQASAVRTLLFSMTALALAACGGGGGGSGSNTGTLKLGITDAPVDAADAVVVQFSGVELKPMNGAAFSIDFASPKTIDLLALQGTNRAMLLDGEKLPAGEYEWMRLKVNADPNVAGDSYVTVDGAQCEMRIPSGAETGLKLVRGFTIGVGTITDFTIDFDLRKSLVRPPGQHTMVESCGGQAYMLKPAMRMVDNLQVGSITGSVDATLVSQKCGADATISKVAPGNVYLFGPYTGTAPVPDDVDGNAADGADPIASAMVTSGANGNTYTIGFVPAGNYVLAYTCDPDQPDVDADAVDTPAGADEVVTFTPELGTTAVVTANAATTVNFTVPAP
ncbi:MAG TPA: DUF4382 domain-containing protein [Steroidobacteraceae bacterium]